MTDTPQAYPLTWPAHRPRTKVRTHGGFKERPEGGPVRNVSIAVAIERLTDEVRKLGGTNAVLSTNLERRLDGVLRTPFREPPDPGAAIYFAVGRDPYALACDRYTSTAQNIAALAAHIEATRAIARHGVASAVETLQAFKALPPPEPPPKPWWIVLGVSEAADPDLIDAAYRVAAKKVGSDPRALTELNLARDRARQIKRLG